MRGDVTNAQILYQEFVKILTYMQVDGDAAFNSQSP